jgi:hypothetical protein
MVNVNYPMELVDGSGVAHTATNGATRQVRRRRASRVGHLTAGTATVPDARPCRALRHHCSHTTSPLLPHHGAAAPQIPGTQNSRARIPTLEEEPLWMKLSTTAPAPAGCAMFRDIRAWCDPSMFPPPDPRPLGLRRLLR